MKVNEIFYSIQGEGSHAGSPCIFVRLSGCNLSCSWCDTTYHNEGQHMTVDEVFKAIQQYDCKLVEITGGEPLLQKEELEELAQELYHNGYSILIETNNTIRPTFALKLYVDKFIVDVKCPSSGAPFDEKGSKVLEYWGIRDEIKFVVADVLDFGFAVDVMDKHLRHFQGNIYFSPVWGQMIFQNLANYVRDLGNDPRVRMQIQMHKIIWDVNRRGV